MPIPRLYGPTCDISARSFPSTSSKKAIHSSMPVDHVRSAAEYDTVPEEPLVGAVDVTGSEVEDRIPVRRALGTAGEEQPRTVAVEERKIAERVEVP